MEGNLYEPQESEDKGMTLYDFDTEFEQLMDRALNELSPKAFNKFLDDISMILADYEVEDGKTD